MLSGHWGTILDHTSPFGTIWSLRYNIWPYLSNCCCLVTEVQYLIIPLSFSTIRSTEVQYLPIPLHLVLSGHWGTLFDHTSPFVAIRSLRYNVWPHLSIWCYQVTEVHWFGHNILTTPLHLVLSGHWDTIFVYTPPFGTTRSLRYNFWPYLSICYYQVTEVKYLTMPLHLLLSGHWGTTSWPYLSICYYQVTEVQYLAMPLHLVLSGHGDTIFDHTSPFGTISSRRYNTWPYLSIWWCQVTEVQYLINISPHHSIWCYQVTEIQYLIIPLHLVLSGHGGIIFDHTPPFGAIRSLRYNIWPYLSIWYYQVTEVQYLAMPLHLVLSGHGGTIFGHTSPFGGVRSLRCNISPHHSIWCYQVTEVQYLIMPLHWVLSGHWGTIFDNAWPYLFIPLHLLLSGHWGTIFDHTHLSFSTIRSRRYNIWTYLS